MRRLCLALCCSVGFLCVAQPAFASVGHTVEPGETLWSIAAANGFTTRSFAAANGLSPYAQLRVGSVIRVPTVSEAAAALGGQAGAPSSASSAGSAPGPMGGYAVRYGDTLSAIAARSGVSVGAIAAMNGLSPGAVLLAGTVLKLPTGAPTQGGAPASIPRVIPQAPPYAAPGRVSSTQVAQVAAQHGVPGSLASAIAWQESGFNNSMVSGANARGVMQILPGTWTWIQSTLARRQLDPNSALDNVDAGVSYLGSLLRSTGDPAMAAAAYYQGLGSVQRVGMLPATRRYVNNVMALRGRFGGP